MGTRVLRPTRVDALKRIRLAPTAVHAPRPLVRPAPRSAIFFPLVVLLAVLPGMAALRSWDLTLPGPLWGLRAMAVVDGLKLDQTAAADDIKPVRESAGFRSVALQPPLYAWLAAVGLTLSGDCDPLACVLPSYMAGVIVVILMYFHGRLWRGGGVGFTAALLMSFNPHLLLRMQEVTPSTLALAGALACLFCYGRRTQCVIESAGAGGAAAFWTMVGGLALGLSLLAVEGLGLLVIPVVLLHQVYLRAGADADPSFRPRTRNARLASWCKVGGGLGDVLLALGVALATAAPWRLYMIYNHGWDAVAALNAPPVGWETGSANLLATLLALSPVTLPLGLYGAVRMIRLALTAETEDRETIGGSLWVVWLAVSALALSLWPNGPRPSLELFLLVPLNLLAASTVADLVNRRVSVRALVGLAPATALAIAWWAGEELRGGVEDLFNGRAGAATILGLHVTFDLIVISVLLTRGLDRWARGRDDRQRRVLTAFLLATLAVAVGAGVREVVFRHSETNDLLMLRTMILRRNREQPFHVVAVVSPHSVLALPSDEAAAASMLDAPYPGGRLRFILRTALPNLPQLDLTDIDELLSLPDEPRLVILYGAGQRLSYAVQSRLGLEAIHPGRTGILDAYATASNRGARR
ncbi:hypothetical protein BSF38_03001 [Paludisphaera borealis]|uniref:Glycosyltransferase RgtA/B/C/D-like domain-containing protein n=1 Tax=Paludisphaera borealis TaxID=1387353 RepID=A0A1U7CRG4_9BACT|nr:hypothetical protein BSF38_03001 [Paludisphaera borealis]